MKAHIKAKSEMLRLTKKEKFADSADLQIFRLNIQPPYVVVILKDDDNKEYMGVAKCSPNDKFDPSVGQSIAMSRAMSVSKQ